MREVIPTVVRRFDIDPRRVAIGGISMGGFGAYDLALLHPERFCAVGGHSPALWLEAGETAPGAFDDAADFERNDVVGMVRGNPDAFAGIRSGTTTATRPVPRRRRRLRRLPARRRRRPQRPHLARRPRRRLLGPPLGAVPALLRELAGALRRLVRFPSVAFVRHSRTKATRDLSCRESPRAGCRAAVPGPSFRGRRWSRSGSSGRPSPGCRGRRRRSP